MTEKSGDEYSYEVKVVVRSVLQAEALFTLIKTNMTLSDAIESAISVGRGGELFLRQDATREVAEEVGLCD